jgi:uncharacterized protein YegP (UPF0339 family)
MRTFVACIIMLSFLAGFASMAEDKAREPKEKGKIVITEGRNSIFRFIVWDSEGNLLAMSGLGGYPSEKDAKEAIASLKEVMTSAKVTVQKAEK